MGVEKILFYFCLHFHVYKFCFYWKSKLRIWTKKRKEWKILKFKKVSRPLEIRKPEQASARRSAVACTPWHWRLQDGQWLKSKTFEKRRPRDHGIPRCVIILLSCVCTINNIQREANCDCTAAIRRPPTPRRGSARNGPGLRWRGTKEGFYGYEKTPVRSDSCALLATRFGSVSAEDLVARISHFAAPVSGTLVRVRCACVFFYFFRRASASRIS